MESPPVPPPKKCERCNAPPLKKPDPDGRRLCFAHSQAPEIVAKRAELAATGRAAGERQRGVPSDKRKAAIAGIIDLDTVRAQTLDERRAKKNDDAGDKADPIDLGSKRAILEYLGKEAGRLSVTHDGQGAAAAATLARTALAVLAFEDPDTDEADKPARKFAFVTTEGRAVNVRGRETQAGN